MTLPRAISLFSGAFGLDLGMEQAGVNVLWANELEPVFCETIRRNRPEMNIGEGDINGYDPLMIAHSVGVGVGELDLIFGGPPCQSFSTAGKRMSVQDPRGDLIFSFLKWVDVLRPRFFMIENVRGLLSAAIRHRPLAERSAFDLLDPDETRGSAMRLIEETVESLGYTMKAQLLNAAEYGTPQLRHRVVIIGSRDNEYLSFPKPTHSENGAFGLQPFRTLRDAIGDLNESDPQYQPYSIARLRWLQYVPSGGNWRDLPREFHEEAMGGAYRSGGGKVGFYRRLSWDKPSPTVTTSPHQKATDMCHPNLDRPISVREAARIQEFPDSWAFAGNTGQQYKQIGNAVPVGFAHALGVHLVSHIQGEHQIAELAEGEIEWPRQLTLKV